MKRISILFALFILVYALSGQTLPNSQYYSSVGGEVSDSLFIPVDTSLNRSHRTLSISGQRIIYWVHGLGGSSDSWHRAASVTQYGSSLPDYPSRNVLSSRPSYGQSSDLLGAAMDLDLQMTILNSTPQWDTVPRDRHFVIAHSQGGLVSKMLDSLYSDSLNFAREFGGMVFFGTPHTGAEILNNASPQGKDMLVPFARGLCNAVVNTKIMGEVERIKSSFFSHIIRKTNLVPGISGGVCDFIESTMFAAMFSDYSRPITTDYWVGANEVNKLNEFESSIPMIEAYGIEESPVFWRTMTSILLEDTTSSIDPFGFDDDSYLVDSANRTIARFYSNYQWNKKKADETGRRVLQSLGITAPFEYFVKKGAYLNTAKAYHDAYLWFVTADQNWERIIGARKTELVKQGYRCMCQDERIPSYYVVNKVVNSPSECTNSGNPFLMCFTNDNYVYVTTVEQSDGVVLRHSAEGLNNPVKTFRMNKTNHIQMRNCSQTKQVLNAVFNGLGTNNLYFITPIR